MKNDLAPLLGNYISDVKCESFLDSETNRIRVRPLAGQGLPIDIVIECSKYTRESHPVGTKFYTPEVKVCIKPGRRYYLRAKDQMIDKLE